MLNFRKFLEGQFLKLDEAGDGTGGTGGGSGEGGGEGDGQGGTGGGDGQGGEGEGDGDGDGSGDDGDGDGDGDSDLKGLDEKTQAYIKKLRKENAKYRTGKKQSEEAAKKAAEDLAKVKEALGLKEDETPLEEQVQQAQGMLAEQGFGLAVRDLAIEHGISGKDSFEYFEFLMSKAAQSLEEGEEMDDEMIAEIVKKAQGMNGNGGNPPQKRTSTGNGGGGDNPPSNGGDTMGVDEFVALSFVEKGQLFGKNPDLYKKLNAEAVAKRLL